MSTCNEPVRARLAGEVLHEGVVGQLLLPQVNYPNVLTLHQIDLKSNILLFLYIECLLK